MAIAVVASRSGGNRLDAADLAVEEIESVRDQVCACPDEACRREALGRMDLFQEQVRNAKNRISSEQDQKIKASFDAIGKCVHRSADRPTPDNAAGN